MCNNCIIIIINTIARSYTMYMHIIIIIILVLVQCTYMYMDWICYIILTYIVLYMSLDYIVHRCAIYTCKRFRSCVVNLKNGQYQEHEAYIKFIESYK